MEKARSELAKKFWDRSRLLNQGNEKYKEYVKRFLAEKIRNDAKNRDITAASLNLAPKKAKASVIANQSGIIAGIEEISLLPDIKIKVQKPDGSRVNEGDEIIEIEGVSTIILSCERTLLNILQRMSGIATETYNLNYNLKQAVSNKCLLLGTRKTLWNSLDKKALSIGGALTHRLSLNDGILIKDNYLKILENNIEKALSLAANNSVIENQSPKIRDIENFKNIEIEVESTKDAIKAAEIISKIKKNKRIIKKEEKIRKDENKEGNSDEKMKGGMEKNLDKIPEKKIDSNGINNDEVNFAILLDNIPAEEIKELIQTLKQKQLYDSILFEASGNIDKTNIIEYAESGVDAVSIGSLTHSVKAMNISLEIKE